MLDHSIEPTLKRVAVLPWPEMPGCYLVLSGAMNKRQLHGEKWYAGHVENKIQYEDEPRCNATITFTYVANGIAAEWDGEHGPIQLWYKSTEGHKEGYDEARAHWLWPWAFGAGHWSQMAVKDADLTNSFNKGDWSLIFSELKSWVHSRLNEASEAGEAA